MFDESKHPRDESGKFTNGGAKEYRQNTPYEEITKEEIHTPNIDEVFGDEFKGYKGQAAVDKLLTEKRGHIKGAFHRDDVGDIDLIWGNDFMGLQHIIKNRESQGVNAMEFLSNIAEVVEKGEYKGKNQNNTFEFWYKGKMAIISPEYHGKKVTFLLTAFKRQKNKGSQTATL